MTNAPPPPQPPVNAPSPAGQYGQPGTIKPSGYWYLLAVVLLFGGLFIAGTIINETLDVVIEMSESMNYFDAPGQVEYSLEKPGTYAIYLAKEAEAEDTIDPALLEITVTLDRQNEPITLKKPEANIGTDTPEKKQLRLLYTFELRQPGVVNVSVKPVEGKEEQVPNLEMVLGRGFTLDEIKAIGKRVFFGIAAGLVGFLLALLIFIVVTIKRSACKRRMLNPTLEGNNPYNPPPVQ